MSPPLDCSNLFHWSPLLSAVVASAVVLVPVTLAFVAVLRALWIHAYPSPGDAHLAPELCEGQVARVHGTACSDLGPVLRATVTEQLSPGSRRKAWKAVGRSMSARAFRLRVASGEILHVEPGADVALDAVASQTETDGPERRRRVAEVLAGQSVRVTGIVRRASQVPWTAETYRDTPSQALALYPNAKGILHIDATPPATLAYSLRYLAKTLAVFLLAQALLVGGYHLRAWAGTEKFARIEHKYVESGKRTTYYRLVVNDGRETLDLWASESCYQRATPGVHVPVITVPFAGWVTQLGSRPTLNWALGIVSFFPAIIGAIGFLSLPRFPHGERWTRGSDRIAELRRSTP